MIRLLLPLVFFATTLVSAQAQKQGRFELGLIPGATLKLELSSGNYRIESGAADRLIIESLARDPQEQKRVRFGLIATRQEAQVKVTGPSHVEASIKIPKNVNLRVRLSGGRLIMTGIEGDKDIESNAGQVSINIGKPQDYCAIDASVNIGDIEARALPGIGAGPVHSLNATGPGKYRLHVHLGAGQIRLLTEDL